MNEIESNSTRTTATAATLGTAISGQLSSTADVDYFKYTVGSSGLLAISFDSPVSSSYGYFSVSVYNTSGTLLASQQMGMDQTFNVSAIAAGDYYVAVSYGNNGYYSSNQYSITATHKATNINVTEDTRYVLNASDFPVDSLLISDTYAKIKISSIDNGITLKLNDIAIIAGQEITASDINSGSFTVDPSLNFTVETSFQYQIFNGISYNVPVTLAIGMAPVNDAPIITSSDFVITVNENVTTSTVIYDVEATDVDSSISYSLSGIDASYMNINSSSGIVTFKSSPNYLVKNSYSFNVIASDGDLNDSKAIIVSIVNEAPTITAGSITSLMENTVISTVIYTVHATDPDAGTTLSYSLSGIDADLLNINSSTGEITLKASADYETKNSYRFDVIASDKSLTDSKPLILTINDLDEAPNITSGSFGSIIENSPLTTIVYDADAVDPEGSTVNYTLGGTDANLLNINSGNGQVTLKSLANYASKSTYNFDVTVSDGNLSSTQSVIVNVNGESETNDSTNVATTSAVGISMTGGLSTSSDVDYYKYTVNTPGVYNVNFDLPINASTGSFNLSVYDESGVMLGSLYSIADKISFNFSASKVGDYYVKINSTAIGWYSNQYTLLMSNTSENPALYELENNGIAQNASLGVLGSSMKGQLASESDRDYYKYTIDSEGPMKINFSGSSSMGVFKISVLDANENLVNSFSTRYASSFTSSSLVAGDYFVKVEDDPGYYSYLGTTYAITVNETPKLIVSNAIENGKIVLFISSNTWLSSTNSLSLTLNYDSSIGHFETYQTGGSGVYSVSTSVTESGSIGTLNFSSSINNLGDNTDFIKLVFTPTQLSGNFAYNASSITLNSQALGIVQGNYDYHIQVIPTSSNVIVTTHEDISKVFALSDFSFSDANVGDTLSKVMITTLPTAGTLKLNGVAVILNQEITASDINDSKLIFTPAANAFGAAYTSFGFKVSDGTAYSASSYTATINVTSVLDNLNLLGTANADLMVGDTIDFGSNDTISGLSGNDMLMGKYGNDTLNGGTGSDTLNGGLGNDTYLFNIGDGNDTVLDYNFVHAMVRHGFTKHHTMKAVNAGNDVISFGEGISIDMIDAQRDGSNLLLGVRANGDTTAIDQLSDLITIGRFFTTKGSSEFLTLDNGSVYNLSSWSIGTSGTDTLNGSGRIYGGQGNDLISSTVGNDILNGGSGTDTFVFNTALNTTTNKDTITDFNAIDDTIQLENSIFTALSVTGTLNSANFRANTTGTASDANDYILYNTSTGVLSYDADGNGAGVAVEFAILGINTHPTITNVDFIII